MPRPTHTLAVALATGTVAASLLLAPTTAHAANLPYDGKDPNATGCAADGRTMSSAPIRSSNGHSLGTIELRYSLRCHTAWARITSNLKYVPYDSGMATATIIRTSDNKRFECKVPYNEAPPNICYTRMVYGKGVLSYAHGEIDDGMRWYSANTAKY